MQRGIAVGAVMAMTPDKKNTTAYARQRHAERMAEYAANDRRREPRPFWPALMPGGWPLPPDYPSDDENTWWPEVDGWPCPPPELRGPAA